jgi:lipid-binding SYLF domain-containing protein
MKKLLRVLPVFIFVTVLSTPTLCLASAAETAKVYEATAVLSEIMKIPEQSIPPELLKSAHAVAVIPQVIKAGFVVGGQYGTGILVVRNKENKWSAPTFITITGGSVGYQIGVESTDLILVFKTSKSIEEISRGKITLGAGASVAAGPVGRSASAATDIKLKAEIFSYSRTRGVFAGVAIQGSSIAIDNDANQAYYKQQNITSKEVFSGKKIAVPESAKEFIKLLASYTD